MSIIIKIENLYKQYSLGVITHKNLQKDFQSFLAKIRGLEDPNSLLSLKNDQTKIKKNEILALKNVNLEISRNMRIGLIGKNGSGKSTLLKIISRVTVPTKGTVYLYGNISSLLEVGVGFHPELTGRENIYLNGSIHGIKKKNIEKYLKEIINFSESEKYIDTPVKRYSSGMIVKLGFSISSVFDSDILLIDEILAVGDKRFREKAITKMIELSNDNRKTIIFVSHNMELIEEFCEKCILLDNGELKFFGDTQESIKLYSQY